MGVPINIILHCSILQSSRLDNNNDDDDDDDDDDNDDDDNDNFP